ncbi:hypothetical protein [Staphylococcus carnosus]|uniref:hypothetical protein n=1 Tax=Staphylococcus carnosus TaxID=1281 RepID=UPI0006AB9C70|nr:hypothetical protein [Staphylococcus carnosus]ANZ34514.1 hypothetical protein BEK99_12480 [Staphylococcus carnosus]KOR12556.1 hypothetical protein AMC75_08740 [Staphylococcus carnosus]POA03129.1 hypothetical protein CD153_05230 [Staphylococcus carnosus]QRQ04082.1 hypothetical protein I6J34_07145 [Staphylococcus carnosus]UTB79606.1 hypothetical protein A2I65_01190 [Staphylococcus carnosus]
MDYIKKIKEELYDIKSQAKKADITKLHIAPNIAEKVLGNAEKVTKKSISKEYLLGIIDTSLTGRGKEGIYFSGEKIVIKEMLTEPVTIYFSEIEEVIIENRIKKDKKLPYNIIKFKNGDKYEISDISSDYIDAHLFAKLVNEIIVENAGNDFSEKNQITPLEDLGDKEKFAYIKILCNYAFFDDDIIDSKEYEEIINFVVRVKLDKSFRIPLRMYMMNEEKMQSTDELISYLEESCYEEEFELIIKSLVKDIISIFMLKENKYWKEDKFLTKIINEYNVTDGQVEFFIMSYKQTQDILTNKLDDKEIAKKYKDLNANAKLVGMPLAALFLTGTGGVSAIGITSGFSLLGMGSLIGISSLFTGIGPIAVAGIASYKGFQNIMGTKNQQKNNKHRELMLKEIVKNKQLQLQYLIEDNNSLIEQLANSILQNKINDAKVKKLARIAKKVGRSQKNVANDVVNLGEESTLINVPQNSEIVIN